MRVADYIWKFFADKGVKHVFLVTGGRCDASQRCTWARIPHKVCVQSA